MSTMLNSTGLRSDPAPLLGMVLAASAFALLTSVDTIFKLMVQGHPPYQILFINGFFAIMPIVAWAFLTGGPSRLHTERPFLHVGRGSISVTSAYCAIMAYSRLPLADYYAILFSGPLVVTALSSVWLGEKIDRKRWLAIACGFAGVLLVAHPAASPAAGADDFHLAGRALAILSVFFYSISVILIRRMRIRETNIAFAFYGYLSSVLIGGGLAILLGGPQMTGNDVLHLAFSGFLAGVSSICLMTAYHRSPVALVAPFQYTQIFWGALAGWILWRQVPGDNLIAGAAIVAASGLYVIYREIRMAEGRKIV